MKRLRALVLALALAGALALPALADGPVGPNPCPEEVTPPVPLSCVSPIFLNGEALDLTGLPGVPAMDLLPLRLVAEADHGSAYWDEEENSGSFYLGEHVITVAFADNKIEVDGSEVKAQAFLADGVTFVPAGVLDLLEGYEVNLNPELDVYRTDITTPNNAPLVKLAYQIIDETGMGMGMRNSMEEISTYLGIHTENFSEIVVFSPMMINSDTVIIGKLAEHADKEQALADLKARQDALIASFEYYLPGPLEMAKNGKIVESGDYLMLIICPDTDKAIALFESAVAELA